MPCFCNSTCIMCIITLKTKDFLIMISVSKSLPISDLSYANEALIITLMRLNCADNHNIGVI